MGTTLIRRLWSDHRCIRLKVYTLRGQLLQDLGEKNENGLLGTLIAPSLIHNLIGNSKSCYPRARGVLRKCYGPIPSEGHSSNEHLTFNIVQMADVVDYISGTHRTT